VGLTDTLSLCGALGHIMTQFWELEEVFIRGCCFGLNQGSRHLDLLSDAVVYIMYGYDIFV